MALDVMDEFRPLIADSVVLTLINNEREDQVLFIDLGLSHARGERSVNALGLAYSKMDMPCFVV